MLKSNKSKILCIILTIIIILLIISNIYFINKNKTTKEDIIVNEEYVYEKVEGTYDVNKKYYKSINYSKFKTYLKEDKLRTIAVIDNSSNTYSKFLQTINKIAFYRRINIYLLETSKLSNKNEIAFYEIDDRFKELGSNYIMTVRDDKILSITTFENEYLNIFEEGIGE